MRRCCRSFHAVVLPSAEEASAAPREHQSVRMATSGFPARSWRFVVPRQSEWPSGGHLALHASPIVGCEALNRDYIPEVSEIRMVRRAPDRPFALNEEDRRYISDCLRAVEASFGLEAFPGVAFGEIPARALIGLFIDWWRGLEPASEGEREAHARLPGAIRLLDTISTLMEEQAQRKRP